MKYIITVNGREYATAKSAVMAGYYFSRAIGNFPPWVRVEVRRSAK